MEVHTHIRLALLSFALVLSACAPTPASPSVTPTTLAEVSPTDTPSPTPELPTATFTAVVATLAPSSTARPAPTNTPRPSPTPPVVVSQPFDGGGIPQGCFQYWQTLPTTRALMFRVIAYESDTPPPPCVLQKDGSGISNVEFLFLKKTANDDVEVYDHTENNAPYCAFNDTNGVCNAWVLAQHNNRWPNDAQITNGDYVLRVTINSNEGNRRKNERKFTIKLP